MKQFQKVWQMPFVLLLFPPLFWAGNAVLARGVVGIVPPISLSFFRWSLAFFIILPFGLTHARQDWPLVKEKIWVVLGLGFLGIACFSALLYVAAQTTTSINLAVLQTILPAIVILLNLALLGERVTGRQGVGVAISIVGAVVIIVGGDPRKLVENGLVIGDGIMILAVTLYALYSVVLRFRPDIHPLSLLVYTFGSGILMLFPVYLWEFSTVGGFNLSAGVLLSFLYLGTCPTILAYLCWNQGIKLAGPSSAGLFINLLPVFAAILAVLFLGESVRWYHFAGMVLVFSGMLLFNKQ